MEKFQTMWMQRNHTNYLDYGKYCELHSWAYFHTQDIGIILWMHNIYNCTLFYIKGPHCTLYYFCWTKYNLGEEAGYIMGHDKCN